MQTKITNENGEFQVALMDDGTLDTVLFVSFADGQYRREVRFSQEHAEQFRDEDGRLTDEGFTELADEAVEEYLDILGAEDLDTVRE